MSETTGGITLPEKIDPESIVVNNITDKCIAELKEKYSTTALAELDLSKKENYEFLRLGISEMVGYRTGIEIDKKEKTSRARDFTSAVNQEANRRIGQIREIEKPMKEARAKFDEVKNEQKRLADEEKKKRIEQINSKLQEIDDFFTNAQGKTSEEIAAVQAKLDDYEVTPEIFEEFKNQALVKKQVAATGLETLFRQTKSNEDETKRLKEENKKLEEKKKQLEQEEAERKAEREKRDNEEKRVKGIKDGIDGIDRLVASAQTKEIHEIQTISDEIHEMFELGSERFEEFLEDAEATAARAQIALNQIIENKEKSIAEKKRLKTAHEEQEKKRKEQDAAQKKLDDDKADFEKKKKELSEREENERKAKNQRLIGNLITDFNGEISNFKTSNEIELGCRDFFEDVCERYIVDDDFKKMFDEKVDSLKHLVQSKFSKMQQEEINVEREKKEKVDRANALSERVNQLRHESFGKIIQLPLFHLFSDSEDPVKDVSNYILDAIEKGEMPHITAAWTLLGNDPCLECGAVS